MKQALNQRLFLLSKLENNQLHLMKRLTFLLTTLVLFVTVFTQAQERQEPKKINITGTVIEKSSKQPLEYATVEFVNSKRPQVIFGGVTDSKGNFNVEITAGTYDVKIEFISFKPITYKQKNLTASSSLGIVSLEDDAVQLEGVTIRVEKSTVEIKLDKKVYNVGQDMLVKGGSVSDVLDNVPSVTVDVEGNVSLRGNENVKILIDGRPSNAINVSDALRLIPAESIDKVEVITNPSARYDAEGSGGIINIILKKGKNQGLNGVITASVSDPESYGISGNLNYKSENFNLFTTQGYNYRTGPGNSLTDSEYLNSDGSVRNYIDERRNNERQSEGYNGSFGAEWFIAPSVTWTNTFSYRKNNGENPETASFFNYDANRNLTSVRNRLNTQDNNGENIDYSTNLIKKFKKDGHQLSIDASTALNKDDDRTLIFDDFYTDERTVSIQKRNYNLIQADYVLPLGEKSRFEAGYRGSFTKNYAEYQVDTLNVTTNEFDKNNFLSNDFEYKEKVNALYTQFGSKINKFSYLLGLRWEDSNIDVNQLTSNDFNNKKYNDFFPSAYLTYEISDMSSLSLSYSRRIQRPRGRMLNPFQNRSSDINIFQGNPDLDPSMTNAFDLGYMKRWQKFTLSTSMYLNKTDDVTQFIRRESGDFVDGTPVILSGPINLATEYRFGFEFTLNYNPFKWWRLNSNFNFFRNETQGSYSYINFQDQEVNLDLDNVATSWFARVNSKISLPYGIDWQTNGTYNAPQTTAQGKSLGIISANLALSKDVFKDKGTLTLNVNDLFNSRKRIYETNLPNLNSYSEMQWRERQITLSFTYRFNKKKNEKERQPKRDNGGDDSDFMG
jgi:outer membrane receptor for ferrienterochelin and colicins